MAISLICPGCRRPKITPEKLAGKKAACPFCKAVVQIPHQPGAANVGAGPGVQPSRPAPSLHQRPVSQPDAQAVLNKPGASDSGDGMSRKMMIALIAVPAVAVLVAAIFTWSFEKSRREALAPRPAAPNATPAKTPPRLPAGTSTASGRFDKQRADAAAAPNATPAKNPPRPPAATSAANGGFDEQGADAAMANALAPGAIEHVLMLLGEGRSTNNAIAALGLLQSCGQFFIRDNDEGHFNKNANPDAFAAAVSNITDRRSRRS